MDELTVYDLSSLTNADDVTATVEQMIADQSAAVAIAPRPLLDISVQGSKLTLRWQGSGYMLQENTNLDDPSGWMDVGSNNSPVTITAPTTGSKFYRLRSQ